MVDDIPSILHHISIGTNDFDKAARFYDAVLGTLGCKRVMDFPGAVAYGRQFPEFWVQTPYDGKPAAQATARISPFSPARAKRSMCFIKSL